MWLLISFGWKLFTFPKDPFKSILFWGHGGSTPNGKPWEWFVERGNILLGCAPGSPFDEHPQAGIEPQGEMTCTSAVIDFLGLNGREDLADIIAATVDNDLHGGSDSYSLPALVKALHQNGVEGREVVSWAMFALDAIYEAGQAKRADQQGHPADANLIFPGSGINTAIELAAVWLYCKREPNDLLHLDLAGLMETKLAGRTQEKGIPYATIYGVQQLKRFQPKRPLNALRWMMTQRQVEEFLPAKQLAFRLERHIENPSNLSSVLGFDRIIQSLRFLGRDAAGIARWASYAFDARYNDGELFMRATKELSEARRAGQQRTLTWNGQRITLLWANTDNPAFQSAARTAKVDVFVLRRGNGQTTLFFNKASFSQRANEVDVLLRDAAEALRTAEFNNLGLPLPDRALLRSEGSLANLRVWYYHRALMAIINGGWSAPNVPATSIPLVDIVNVVVAAFEKGTI
jgi:hypothetical protein